jgi:hypothetical protein
VPTPIAGFLNETNSRSHTGANIFLSENDPFPHFNGAIFSTAQIIKFVMASAAKSKLVVLFVTTREMIPHRQTLIVMRWPQPKSPIKTDNSTATGVTNKTIAPRRAKMMDMRLWWLPLPWIPRPILLLLLGCWVQKLGQLPHQTPPGHLP